MDHVSMIMLIRLKIIEEAMILTLYVPNAFTF